jgi:hypothetical protein
MKPKVIVLIVAALGFFVAGLWLGARWGIRWQAKRTDAYAQHILGWSDQDAEDYRKLARALDLDLSPQGIAEFQAKVQRLNETAMTELERNSVMGAAACLAFLNALETGGEQQGRETCISYLATYYANISRPGFAANIPEPYNSVPVIRKVIEEAAEKYPELKAKIDAAQAESTTAQEAPAE